MKIMIGVFACFLIVALDITAGILGMKAEAAQDQGKHVKVWLIECKEPSHQAFVLGLSAIILLGVAHVFANLIGCCCNLCRVGLQKAPPCKKLSMACLVFTWIILIVAMSMLVMGTQSNHKSRESCGFTHLYPLYNGGILCMIHSFFAVAYYVTSTAGLF